MYYLIEHNRTTKHTECTEYGNYIAAQTACLRKEQQYNANHRHEMEVVVFEADSLDALKRTHSRYFVVPLHKDDNVGALVAVGLVGLAVYLLSKK
jgi:hypothetical protein